MTTATQPLACDWCDEEATISVTWECEHSSAMCDSCFGPPDPWGDNSVVGLDILDWGSDGYPMICPDCSG